MAFLLFCSVTLGQAADIANGVTLERLIKSAREKNAQLISSSQDALRYKTRIPLVEKLTDPILAFYYLDFPVGNMSKVYSSAEDKKKAAAVGGATVKVESRRGSILTGLDMVEDTALWYQYLHEDLILTVLSQVRQNFYTLYVLDKIIELNEQNLNTLDSLIASSNASYAVGKVRQKDVLRAQIERYQLQAKLVRLRQDRLSAGSRLSYLTGHTMSAELTPALEAELSSDNLPTTIYTAENLISAFYTHKPLVKGYQALGGRFKAMRSMVKMYFNDEVQDEATYEADSGLRAIAAKSKDYSFELMSDLRTTYGDLGKNRELARLYHKVIVPQGRQFFEASLADFRVGRAEFSKVLNSLLDLNRDQTLYYQALADYMVDFARLEELSGVSLN